MIMVVTTPFKRKRENQRQSRHQRSCFTLMPLGHTRYLFVVFVILCFVIQDVSSMPIPKSTKTPTQPVPHHNNHAGSTKTTTPKTPQSHDHGTSQPHHPHHQQQGASSPAKPHTLNAAEKQKLHDIHQWSTQAKPGETAVQKIARESTGHAAKNILQQDHQHQQQQQRQQQQHQVQQHQQQQHQQRQQQQHQVQGQHGHAPSTEKKPPQDSPPSGGSKDGHHTTTDQKPKQAQVPILTPEQDKQYSSISRAQQYSGVAKKPEADSLYSSISRAQQYSGVAKPQE